MAYSLKFTDISLINLKNYPKKDQIRIIEQIEKLALNSLEKSNVKKLVNFDISYRLRVGSYRIFFEKDDEIKIIDIIDILRRDKAFKLQGEFPCYKMYKLLLSKVNQNLL